MSMNCLFRALRSAVVALTLLFAGTSGDSQACNVPAFRYALERWPADPYQILVYYQRSPPGEAFELLQKGASRRKGAANYSLKAIDVTEPEGKALAEQRKIVSCPWVEIFYPIRSQVRAPVWSGPLTPERARKIVDSPDRSAMAQRLLSGDVAVWVLVKSGHEREDRRALQSLKTHLEQASATLRIPETGTDPNGNPVEVTDFRTYPVRFDLVEIARDDPDEDLLVGALLKSEPDLGRYDEPMAFPVFGRGRALYALVGDGIQEKNIREACRAMLAWCSCEIKAMNPGTDLLIAADWSRPTGGRMVKDLELPLTGLSGFRGNQDRPGAAPPRREPDFVKSGAVCETAPALSRAEGSVPIGGAAPARVSSGRIVRNLLYLAGAAGLALLALSVVVTVKMKK